MIHSKPMKDRDLDSGTKFYRALSSASIVRNIGRDFFVSFSSKTFYSLSLSLGGQGKEEKYADEENKPATLWNFDV